MSQPTWHMLYNNNIVIIKHVPCKKCTQCGEVTYTLDVAERLEGLTDNLRNSLAEVVIINYSDKVA